jgi:hypothetical protein
MLKFAKHNTNKGLAPVAGFMPTYWLQSERSIIRSTDCGSGFQEGDGYA